jgi:hypothetical protein
MFPELQVRSWQPLAHDTEVLAGSQAFVVGQGRTRMVVVLVDVVVMALHA